MSPRQGVTAISGSYAGEPVGFACQSFSAHSSDPPPVSFSVAPTSTTWPRIESSGSFGVAWRGPRDPPRDRPLSPVRSPRSTSTSRPSTPGGDKRSSSARGGPHRPTLNYLNWRNHAIRPHLPPPAPPTVGRGQ
ncbi:flavin reductase family protein [Nocardia sp. NPDC058633]|uniref:flavin reductase family protein n=1 Tax=Nocardia sp. NPDC058633 TaxID=3346568 RepID=UPI003651AD57